MLLIPTQWYNKVMIDAIESYPYECCGFLLGKENDEQRTITKVIVCKNASDQKQKEFLISAEDYKKAEQSADEKGLKLLGIYHSHPDCDAVPSGKDTQNAFPFFSYLIISVFKKKISSVRNWRLSDDFSLKEEPIFLIKTAYKKAIPLMATIIIPTPLRKFTGNSSKVNVGGSNVQQALSELTGKYPDLKKHLFDTEEHVRPFINIFVGEDDIRNLQQQQTTVADSSVISIVPAIAGGSSF